MSTFCICQCYFSENFYSRSLQQHLTYHDREQFLNDYREVLEGCKGNNDEVIKELENEKQRRRNAQQASYDRQQIISRSYKPLHPHVYNIKEEHLSEAFREIVHSCLLPDSSAEDVLNMMKSHTAERVYSFPVFTEAFCSALLEELDNFTKSGLPVGKPNTMNNYGIMLDELGFNEGLITPLREIYLQPLCKMLYPDWGEGKLDSHKAFTVQYTLESDRSLSWHYDNSEVTLNVCLGKDFDDGALFFGKMNGDEQSERDWVEVNHQITHGVLHRGQHMHGAMPIQDGKRVNLIIWMRCSEIRNKLCPMCRKKPQLAETVNRYGDGFLQETVDLCGVL